MKKYFGILILSLFLFLPFVSFAWDDCVYSEVDCEYPGDCPRYVDTDGDGICDHSQAAPEDRELVEDEIIVLERTTDEVLLDDTNFVDNSAMEEPALLEETLVDEDLISGQDLKTKTVAEVADIYGISSHDYAHALREYIDYEIEPDTEFSFLHDNYGMEPSVVKEIALAVLAGEDEAVSEIVATAELESQEHESVYNFFPLSLILLALYLLTWLLSKFKLLKVFTHRKIWNWILLFSFLLCGISGLMLVIRINYGIIIAWPFNLLWTHVETGIVMALISIFHIIWHWPYYLSFLIRKNNG